MEEDPSVDMWETRVTDPCIERGLGSRARRAVIASDFMVNDSVCCCLQTC